MLEFLQSLLTLYHTHQHEFNHDLQTTKKYYKNHLYLLHRILRHLQQYICPTPKSHPTKHIAEVVLIKNQSIGIEIDIQYDYLVVAGVASSIVYAEISSILYERDIILSINSHPVVGEPLGKVVELIKRQPDGELKLTIFREQIPSGAVDPRKCSSQQLPNERLLLKLRERYEELKYEPYFPQSEGYRYRFGSDGTYIGITSLQLEQVHSIFSFAIESSHSRPPQHPTFIFKLHGREASDGSGKAGAQFACRFQRVKLVNDPHVNLPNCEIDQLILTTEWKVVIPITFEGKEWKMRSDYQIKLVKMDRLDEGMGSTVPQSLIKWLVNQFLPRAIKQAVEESMPCELGVLFESLEAQDSMFIHGEFSVQGNDLQVFDVPLDDWNSRWHTQIMELLGVSEEQVEDLLLLQEQVMQANARVFPQPLNTLGKLLVHYETHRYGSHWKQICASWQVLLDFYCNVKNHQALSFEKLMDRMEATSSIHPLRIQVSVHDIHFHVNILKALNLYVCYRQRQIKTTYLLAAAKTATTTSSANHQYFNSISIEMESVEQWYRHLLQELQPIIENLYSVETIVSFSYEQERHLSPLELLRIHLLQTCYQGTVNMMTVLKEVDIPHSPYGWRTQTRNGLLEIQVLSPEGDKLAQLDLDKIEMNMLLSENFSRASIAPIVTVTLDAEATDSATPEMVVKWTSNPDLIYQAKAKRIELALNIDRMLQFSQNQLLEHQRRMSPVQQYKFLHGWVSLKLAIEIKHQTDAILSFTKAPSSSSNSTQSKSLLDIAFATKADSMC